ncbi:MAG: ferredoxin family protein [Candidatus Dadabacteria bacterium]|nr:MAG: ferredoxin family protein [Candidatus Dadabacteria bacterium]
MPYVIGKNCIGTKDTACVEVCPVDCIHPKPDEDGFEDTDQLYIDPDVCIDCGVCEPECPVEAIYSEDAVPDDEQDFIEKNADYYQLSLAEFKEKWKIS